MPAEQSQSAPKRATTTSSFSSMDRKKIDHTGADLLLSLAERAAEHASSASSSGTSSPTTPSPSRDGVRGPLRTVSAERPSAAAAMNNENGKRLASAVAERLGTSKHSWMSKGEERDNSEEQETQQSEQKRIISPVDAKPDGDDSHDEEKLHKGVYSNNNNNNNALGFNLFRGPPPCLFPPNGPAGYPHLSYGPSFPFAHGFYSHPYPYGMMHGHPPPHPHLMYPPQYLQQQQPSPTTAATASRFNTPLAVTATSSKTSPKVTVKAAPVAAAAATTSTTTTPKTATKMTSTVPSSRRQNYKLTTKARAATKTTAPSAATATGSSSSKSSSKLASKKQQDDQKLYEQQLLDACDEMTPHGTAVGGVQSANRCVPRKYIYPPADWRQRQMNVESVQVPDFHLLVNYPDYLARGRNSHNQDVSACGKRFCVMCGKLRVSTSSTLVGRGSTKRSDLVERVDESTTHIIPRQNKGVCTACDVAVWVVLNHPNELEIKWCKGCKNFRPWPAFGDKVLATKCVRCRDRQKEKYAAQKGLGASLLTSKTEADVLAADVLGNLSRAMTGH